MSKPPNILIVMADQMTAGILPAYGNRVAKTPNLDRLAARSVVFENAYCNVPLCAPSRAVLMSGRLPSAIGAFDNAAEFPSQTPTFAHYLRRAGYQTILAGKMHFCGPEQMHGFEERLTTDIYPADYGWTPDWTRPDIRPEWYHGMESVTDSGWCIRTNQIDFDEEVVFAARQKLFDIARTPAGDGSGDKRRRPFCMVVSLTHPHDPFTIPDPWWSRYTDQEIDMPANGDAAEDPHSRRIRRAIGMDLRRPTQEQIRSARRAYYGACSFFDDNAGLLLAALEQGGLAEDTVVILLSDHGEMLGERDLWFKMSFLEASCRIPLMISAPGRFAPARVSQAVSLVDILPTLVDLGTEHSRSDKVPEFAAPIDGRSLLPHCLGRTGHDEVIGEYTAESAVAPIVMIRRDRYKFIHCPIDPDQVFDLAEDPGERRNLVSSEPHAEVLRSFREEVAGRWDLDRLHADILDSQKRRQLVAAALRCGARHSWDHQPVRDASNLYIRSHMKLDDLEARARFPAR